MPITNNFLPFCPTDTGTNLVDQADYAIDPDRSSGNKPGVASSALNNKALRQANYVASQLAQFVGDTTNTDMNDKDGKEAQMLAQMNAAMAALPPVVTRYTSGSGTHYKSYVFFIATGSATSGATYTNNTFTFTVSGTVASAKRVTMVGTGAPTASGTLTKSGGTGDSTLTFYAVRAPLYVGVQLVGAGGGGGGTATNAAQSGAGSGGAGGGYVEHLYTSPAASYAYAVGAAGTAASAGANDGGAGGDSTWGGTLTGGGGEGGKGSGTSASSAATPNGALNSAGGAASGGNILNIPGGTGGIGLTFGASQAACLGGGMSQLSKGYTSSCLSGAGVAGTGYGGGGGGGISINNAGTKAGGAGTAGLIIVTEVFQ